MKVRATKTGFFGSLQNPGDTFEVGEKQFSPTWMVTVEESEEVKETEEPVEVPAAEEKPKRGRPRKTEA